LYVAHYSFMLTFLVLKPVQRIVTETVLDFVL